MIVQFKFRNFKSFKDETILDMTPVNGLKELEQNIHTIESDYINIKESKNKVLKAVAISGQNASGKSNLIKALKFMQQKVTESVDSNDELKKNIYNKKIEQFIFTNEFSSSEFELIFIMDGIKYRYGFELDSDRILKEWLYVSDKGREKEFFIRDKNKITLKNKKNIDEAFIKLAEKSLLEKKSTLALYLLYKDFGVKGSYDILANTYNYFSLDIQIIDKVNEQKLNFLASWIKAGDEIDREIFDWIKMFIKALDTRIVDIVPFEDINEKYPFYAIHKAKTKNGETIEKRMPFANESEGTKKIFCISATLLFTLSLPHNVLVVDELDNKIHTNLFLEIIKLFQKSKSQFIFATHNPYIMEHDLLRRDQIYFVDKNEYEESNLYSLSDFQGVKITDSYQKRYLNGNYGAVPIIDFSELEKSLFDKDRDDE
ncbi:MAG: ATP-binding protein [Fusobacteriaceae bacterium]|nr:ATP-binding protein [Fusobacteriaceae bacterium]